MSSDPARQAAKRTHLQQVLAKNPDFVFLQELHSTIGTFATWRPPEGYKFVPSHGTASSAGIGILISEKFLLNFEPIAEDKLMEVVPGRVGGVQLQGPNGCLDLWCLYLTTGDARAERA